MYDHGKKCYGYMGNKKSVTEIIIPEGVTYINEKAFAGLKNLERIRIPDTVTSIGDYAFSKCEKLNDVRLPGSIVNFKPGKCPFEVKYERVKELNKLAVMSFLEDFVKEPGEDNGHRLRLLRNSAYLQENDVMEGLVQNG